MMKFLAVVVLALAALASCDDTPKLWAVLIAGSNEYYNYRHQADVCHAYQILHAHGIPDEQIVVLMYDDIAQNDQNPTKGIIINHLNGSDVYHGVPKDYTGDVITPANFLKILLGEAPKGGSGKKISPGPNDHLFVNFVDHGATGILGFPGSAGFLTVKDLTATMKEMNTKNMYGKFVFYVEACESGSMFDGYLPDNINIYATTASNPTESSYACYYDSYRETYLGDVYSVKWMENSDKADIQTETLQKQFTVTKKETNTSHVMEYGQLDINTMVVGQFQGTKNPKAVTTKPAPFDAVISTDVPLKILEQRLLRATNEDVKTTLATEIQSMLAKRRALRSAVYEFASLISFDVEQADRIYTGRQRLTDIDCHDKMVKYFHNNCLSLSRNTYAMRVSQVLANACEEKIDYAKAAEAIDVACKALPKDVLYL